MFHKIMFVVIVVMILITIAALGGFIVLDIPETFLKVSLVMLSAAAAVAFRNWKYPRK